eukprot:175330-Prorocentrum_minimum.AAC.5
MRDVRGSGVLRETVRRIVALLEMPKPAAIYKEDEALGLVSPPYHLFGAKNTLWDQHTVNDCIESSVAGTELRRRS